MSEAREEDGRDQHGFFAIDRRTWAKLSVPGRMNEAVSYLVQARGTGRDNCTTSWSVEAVERYTGISRGKAKLAVQRLQADGFSRLLRGGTKPKYELVPYIIPTGQRDDLSPFELHVVDLIRRSGEVENAREKQAAYRAASKGWLTRDAQGQFTIAPAPEITPDLIWLPNELVTGAAGEIPPLELVRQTQDPMTLRLLIDMYSAQNLREDGGVSRQIIWQEFKRIELGRQAQFTVWGFQPASIYLRWRGFTEAHRCPPTTEQKAKGKDSDAEPYFRRQGQLSDLGLFEWVPHLVESESEGESGELIHPVSLRISRSIEDRLRRAAHEAAEALLTPGQYEWALRQDIRLLVPVPRHVANVQLIGIARLRYRPQTGMTAAWWADLNASAEKHLARYAEIACPATSAATG
jgi:hypothetical protein